MQEGGKIITGGKRLTEPPFTHGYYLRPTIITGVPPLACRVQQEEIFGPVITVTPFQTEEQVIEYANGTKYGLSACVWSQNVKRVHRVSKALKAGTIWVNCWMVRDLNMPFGGIKASGLGREGHPYSRDFFCEEKTVCIKM